MRTWDKAALLCVGVFSAPTVLVAADTPPVHTDLLRARPAAWTDPRSRCPDLRQADPGDSAVPVAVVVFHVGSTGVPSQAAIKTSSGSAELDSAALACVMKLKFLPATAAGEGGAVDTWQQIAWRSATHTAAAPAAPVPTAAAAIGAAAAGASAAAGTPAAAAIPTAPAAVRGASTEVRVCADADGKLAQEPVVSRSSGDAAFDAAALEIARSGSGHYRSGITTNGQPAAGCLVLSIRSAGP